MQIARWVLCLVGIDCLAAGLTLVDNGHSPYKIVLSTQASPSERRAAEELQRFLKEISGCTLPIVSDERPGRGPMVLVGRSRSLDRLRVRIPWDELGPEGSVILTHGPHLIIAGGRQRGTMYGVYIFLEKLGCRWFTPEVSRIPKQQTIRLPALHEIHKPSFEYREPFFTEAFDRDWAARNRVNGHFARLDESTGGKIQYYPFVHTFYQLLPPEQYFRDHPEYYSLIAGKRRAERAQLCLTNPEVLQLATQKVLEWIRTHPEATIFSVSQNDWTGWCECDRCRAVEEEEGGAHSGPLLRFVNAIAEEVEKHYPDKLIDTLAYWYTEAPPARVRPRRNVRIRLCPIGACQAHPYERCDRNAYFMARLRAWAKITNQLYVWHYNTNFAHYLMPFPDFDELIEDIPMYHRHGVVGLFLEGAYPPGGGGEMAELRSYVMARLLWDVRSDGRQAMREFLDAVYGNVAPLIGEYLELLHRQVRMPPEGRGHHLWIFQHPSAPYLEREFLGQARQLLERAEREAADPVVQDRVRKVKLSIDYVELVRSMAFEIRDGWYGMPEPDRIAERFRKFLDEVRRFGIQQLHEGRSLESDEKELEQRLQQYGVVTLENDVLKVELVPALNARIVQLRYKPSNSELLYQPDPGERGYPNTGGIVVQVHPDYQASACAVQWQVLSASSQLVRLVGSLANGLRLYRVVRLRGDRLELENRLENGTSAPVVAALQVRASYGAGRPEDARLAIAYPARDGRRVDRTLFEPGLETSGAETLTGGQMPAGLWKTFHRAGGVQLVNSFRASDVEQVRLEWSVRGDNRVSLVLWSPEVELVPGSAVEMTTEYWAQSSP